MQITFPQISPVMTPLSFFCCRIKTRGHNACVPYTSLSSGLRESLSFFPLELTLLKDVDQVFNGLFHS